MLDNKSKANFIIREYEQEDIPVMVELVKQFLEEERVLGQQNHFFGIDFNPKKIYNLLESNKNNPRFFTNIVTNIDDKIIGGLSGGIHSYIFSDELVAQDYIFYFDPKSTNLTALFALITSYVDWAEKHKVREVQLRSSTGFKQEKFSVLMKYCKFTQFEIGFSRRFR